MLPITEHAFELSKQQFWIQLGYDTVGKLQIFQHFVHVEVNLTFSTAGAVKKVVLWASDIMIYMISLQE